MIASHIPRALKPLRQNADLRVCDRLFTEAEPEAGEKDFFQRLNLDSLKVLTAYVETSLAPALPVQQFQFERFGYFVTDRLDHAVGAKPVFHRVTGLKDSLGK